MELDLEKPELPKYGKRPFIIAGPCSAESEEQVMETATQLARNGCKIFRAGVWKPRTKPGGFEGHGEPALAWLKRVKEETGMLVTIRYRPAMGGRTHHYQPLCDAGFGRFAERNRHNGAREKPDKPRPRTVDRSIGTTQRCRYKATRSNTPWLLKL